MSKNTTYCPPCQAETMPPSPATLRTYGKRPRTKRKISLDAEETLKRRRFSEDPVTRTPSPTRTEKDATDTDVEVVEGSSTPVKPKTKVLRTYGTPSGTPSRLVRDLSGIFESMSPSSPSATPTKIAKRMLGRSKTESSVESPSPSVEEQHYYSGIDRTSSLPNLPSSSSAAVTPDRLSSKGNSKSSLPLSKPTIFPTAPSSSTTRTYAGKYRSFLMALPASSSGSTQGLTNEDEFETRESYSSLRSRWGVDNSEDDPHPTYDISSPANSATTTSEASPSRNGNGKGKTPIHSTPIPNGMMNPLKSISELRNKGESRRFLDEVGYLFEGLDPKCGIALRRSSALEITTKLCDPEFTRKAKAADFFGRTWELLLLSGAGKGDDKILDILLVFFLALIASDPVSLAELAERPTTLPTPASESQHESGQHTSLVDTLNRILETVTSEDDLLALSDQNSRLGGQDVRKSSIPKKDRTIISSILKVITSKAMLFPPSTPISTPLLITSTLQALSPSYLSASCLPTLLTSLRQCLSPHAETQSTTKKSLYKALSPSSGSPSSSWLDIVNSLPYESIYHHLKLMDSFLVGQWTGSNPNRETQAAYQYLDKARDEWIVQDLVAFGVCCEVKSSQEETNEDDKPGTDDDLPNSAHQRCLTLALRVLISLTHSHKGWAEGVLGCTMTMGLILRIVWKAGRELLDDSGQKDEQGVSEDEDDDKQEEGKDVHVFDTLCLVLGLLTNLVQVADLAKDVVRRSRLNALCSLQNRACAKRCTCPQKALKDEEKERNGVEVLVWLYDHLQQDRQEGRKKKDNNDANQERNQQQEHENEAQTSFLCGHLSVLFGLLMMGNSGLENQRLILGAGASQLHRSPSRVAPKREQKGRRRNAIVQDEDNLPTTRRRTKLRLDKLTEQVREFGAFYSVVSRRMAVVGGRRRTLAPACVGGGRDEIGEEVECEEDGGSRVVKDVVEFLEGLRHGVVEFSGGEAHHLSS